MHFWIYSEFTKILGQFKQKTICRFSHDMKLQVFFLTFKFKFWKKLIILNKLLIKIFQYFDYKS